MYLHVRFTTDQHIMTSMLARTRECILVLRAAHHVSLVHNRATAPSSTTSLDFREGRLHGNAEADTASQNFRLELGGVSVPRALASDPAFWKRVSARHALDDLDCGVTGLRQQKLAAQLS